MKITTVGKTIEIVGDYSPHPVYIDSDLVLYYGSAERAYHAIKRNRELMPRKCSAGKPFNYRDMCCMERNIDAGERRWQWKRLSGASVRRDTGYDSVWGYCRKDGKTFTFVDDEDNESFVVNVD